MAKRDDYQKVYDYVSYDYSIHRGAFYGLTYEYTPAKFKSYLPEHELGPMSKRQDITIQQFDSILHTWGAKRIDQVEDFRH